MSVRKMAPTNDGHLGVYGHLKMIPQKLKLPIKFFENFPECSLPSTVLKNTIKMIGHHSRLRDLNLRNHLKRILGPDISLAWYWYTKPIILV